MRRSRNGGRFEGGPLMACSWELDAMYYGTIWENDRRMREWKVANAYHLEAQEQEGIEEPEDLARPSLLGTTEWMRILHLIEDPEYLPGHANPMKAVDFRLDILRALSKLPPSRVRVFVHFMDGYDMDEISSLMGRNEELGEGWDRSSVARVIREVSRACRSHGDSLGNSPNKGVVASTLDIGQVESTIDEIRTARATQIANRNAKEKNRAHSGSARVRA